MVAQVLKASVPVLLLALTLTARDADQNAPIKYSVQNAATQPAGQVAFSMENTSAKPIAAYVLRIVCRDRDGKTTLVETYSAITRGLGLGKGRPSFRPGEQWSESVKAPGGDPAEVQLDLVLFEDGTHWGPNKANRLERLLGMRAGARLQQSQ